MPKRSALSPLLLDPDEDDEIDARIMAKIHADLERQSQDRERRFTENPPGYVWQPSRRLVKLAKIEGAWRCHYCWTPLKPEGKQHPTLDHKIPRVLGGTSKAHNIVLCCTTCNSRKGARHTYQEYYEMTAPNRTRNS